MKTDSRQDWINTRNEENDPILANLRRRVQQVKFHEPKPGDADYLTPEQVAWIKEEDDEY